MEEGGMNWATMTVLSAAGLVGGIVNAVAGGATLITFPAMLHAGLAPVIANASNAVAIMPGHLVAALADRGRLPGLDRRMVALVVASVGGGALGAAVLLVLPERLFTLPIPALIALATLLFAFAPTIQARAAARRQPGVPPRARGTGTVALASVYGGFFGAGLGIILTAVLSITEAGDIRSIKALKNLLASAVSLVATAIFIVQGAVHWPETLVMLAGAILGGYAGGQLIRILPGDWVRRIVILAGAIMSVIYGIEYWM
jgi:uncharacterized membrane protein YfcA